MNRPTNGSRRINGAKWLNRAEEIYGNGDIKDSLTDMLTDIRHYCGRMKIDFDNCVLMSEIHHNDELQGKE